MRAPSTHQASSDAAAKRRSKKSSRRRRNRQETRHSGQIKVALLGVVMVAVGGLSAAALTAGPPSSDASYTAHPVPTFGTPRVEPESLAFIGDSYLAANEASDWVATVTDEMPVPAKASISASGGSGYVTRGLTDSVFGEHVAEVVSATTDVVVFFGSRNDADADDVAAAAGAAYAEALAIAPAAKLVVVGPVWTNEDVPDSVSDLNDELRSVVTGSGGTYVDAIAEGWFFNENAALIGSDGVHPSDEGRTYIAGLMLPYLTAALG